MANAMGNVNGAGAAGGANAAGGAAAGGAAGGNDADFQKMLGDLQSMYKQAQKSNMELRMLTVREGTTKKAAEQQVQGV